MRLSLLVKEFTYSEQEQSVTIVILSTMGGTVHSYFVKVLVLSYSSDCETTPTPTFYLLSLSLSLSLSWRERERERERERGFWGGMGIFRNLHVIYNVHTCPRDVTVLYPWLFVSSSRISTVLIKQKYLHVRLNCFLQHTAPVPVLHGMQ